MKRIYLSLSLLLLVIIGSRAANFKFAFLTDIHITAEDSIPYNDLARSVNQINDTPGIEFAIVSGDITNIGDRKSMEVVKSLLDRLNVDGSKFRPYHTNGRRSRGASGHRLDQNGIG